VHRLFCELLPAFPMTASVAPVDYQRLFHSLPENLLLMAPDATIIDNTDSHVAASLKPRAEVVRGFSVG
jgi:hypothetical protein